MNPHTNIEPPKWPLKILRFFLRKEYLEEIEGDMEEIFYDNIEQTSPKKAKNSYVWEMLKLMRPSLVKNLEFTQNLNQYSMIKNYSKTSLRNLMKNPLSSFINIFGLSMAIGVTLVVYTFIAYDLSTDDFHVNEKEVYLATFFADRDGKLQQYGLSPTPIGEMLKADFPQIKKMCRVEDGSVVLKYENKVFYERVRYVDPEFLEMLTFPLKWGLSSSLRDINTIILSEEISIKYFGQENPVGQDILMVFGENNSKMFTVGGVAEAFPRAHDIDFSILVNFENLRVSKPKTDLSDWSQLVNATLIQVDDPSAMSTMEAGMDKYRLLQNEAQNERPIVSFSFEQLAVLHDKKIGEIRNAIARGYPPEGRLVMPIIALFLLALACFNYINIAIVSASKRLKEIALRKVIGANRGAVIFQFLAENILITFFALATGLLLGAFVFVPWFNNLFQMNLHVNFLDTNLWMFLMALLLFTGISSGLYPAFYISKFQVVNIFGGSVKFGKKNVLTKVFLCIQLILACITIVCGVMFTKNTYYVSDREWGYDQENTLYVQAPTIKTYNQLKNELVSNPNILAMSGSRNHIGKNYSLAIINRPDKNYEVNQFKVDAKYIENLGVELESGRHFIENSENDKTAIIVNQTLVKNFMINTPIGEILQMDSAKYEIIGVVKDFHAQNFDYEIRPMVFRVAEPEDYRFLTIKVESGKELETLNYTKEKWAEFFPETPFLGELQIDLWSWYFRYIDSTASFMKALAFLSVLLASLGLYGLVTLNVSGRVREFSVRKILGAKLSNIAFNITKQYATLVSISLLIGAPLSYLIISMFLDMVFSYHVPVEYSGIAFSMTLLILTLTLVVLSQVRKVSNSNPVDGLKVE